MPGIHIASGLIQPLSDRHPSGPLGERGPVQNLESCAARLLDTVGPAFRRERKGGNAVVNGFGEAADIERERASIEADLGCGRSIRRRI